MTPEQIIAANKKSTLEQLEQDERNEEIKAGLLAVEFMNIRAPRRRQYHSDNPRQALNEVIRNNADAVEVETHRHDEQNN